MNNLIVESIVTSSWFVPVNKMLIKNIGPMSALFLGELVNQRRRFKQDEFFFSQIEMEEEIGLSPKQQRLIIKKISELNIINVISKGIPRKNWYTINNASLFEYSTAIKQRDGLTVSSAESAQLEEQNSNISKSKNVTSILSNTKKEIIRKEYNTCGVPLNIISDWSCEAEENTIILENSNLGKEEKNSEKKEKLDNLSNYCIWENFIKTRSEPETQIDKARVLLYIHNTLRTNWKIRWEETFFKKVYAQFKKWIDYKDIIIAMWTLHHNKFCNGEAWWRKWKWDIAYLFDARWIDKVWKFEIDKIDSEISTYIRQKLKNILTLPDEFKSAKNANKWDWEDNYDWMNPVAEFN